MDVSFTVNQKRLWYMTKVLNDSTSWNKITCKSLTGSLDIDKLKDSVKKLLSRHTILYAKVKIKDKEPVFEILPDDREVLQIIDMKGKKKEDALAFMRNDLKEKIDLETGMLFRVNLIIMSEHESILYIKLHHLISDAATMNLLWKDLTCLYNDQQLDKISITYSDIVTLSNKATEDNFKEDELYWNEMYAEEVKPLNLPYAFSKQKGNKAYEVKKIVPIEMFNKIERETLKKRQVPYSFFYSVYLLLLYKYTRNTDIVVGTLFSDRANNRELKNIAGFYVNTLAVRHKIVPENDINELMKTTLKTIKEAHKHDKYPLMNLADKLNADRKNGSMYNCVFNMFDYRPNGLLFDGIEKEIAFEPEPIDAEADISFNVRLYKDRCEFLSTFNSAKFGQSVMDQMLGHYVNLLEQALEFPEYSLDQYKLMGNEETRQFILKNRKELTCKNTLACAEFIEQYKESEKVAIVHNGNKITYRELNARADKIKASILANVGQTNSSIAIYMERGMDFIIAEIGILKAGCAFVPLDIKQPIARNLMIIEDAGVSCIISNRKCNDDFKSNEITRLQMEDIMEEKLECMEKKVEATDTAYILYTSGTTGKPKGIPISNQGLSNCLLSYEEIFGELSKRVGTFTTPVTFDVSVFEIYSILCFGGELHIIDNEIMMNIAKLIDCHIENQVTSAYIYPGLLLPMERELEKRNENLALRRVKIGVEPVTFDRIKAFYKYCPDAKIINGYGTTETTISATYFVCDDLPASNDRVPIGINMPGYQVYLVDKGLNLVPPEVPGEILIGGVGVSKGYINLPELNSSKFIRNPFDTEGFAFLTGDIGKYRDDGNIIFGGREDNQIKYNGFRIEPAEIEKVALQLENVSDAKVVLEKREEGHRMLNLYFTANGGSFDKEILRNTLSMSIPKYMQPANLYQVQSIPYKSSGKIDTEKLRNVELLNEDENSESVTANVNEAGCLSKLIEIVKDTLDFEITNINQSFFANGGTSFMVIQLMLEIEDAFGVELDIFDFLELPTIASIADAIEKKMRECEG